MTRVSRRIATVLICLLAVVLGACGPGTSEPAERQLVIGTSAAPNSMDPTTSDAAAISEALLYNVYETLLKIDGDGNYQPLLASDWSVSSDGLVYTFNLRPQAQFASGTKVSADAVITSIQRIIDDDAVLPVLKEAMKPLASMRAVDDDTVEFTLSEPSQSWLFAMSQRAGIIIDPDHLDQLTTTPAGSGPFMFSNWTEGDSVTLVRNDSYWGTDTKLAGITFKAYDDANAMNAAMLAGQLDIISNVAAPQALDQFQTDQFTVLEGTTTAEVVLGFNQQVESLQDVKVRQAINYAIDRQALVDAVWGGKGELIGSMVPPTDPWYEDLSGQYPYDPDKARELLDEAGATGLNLRMRVPSLPYGPGVGSYVASQLQAVGINVTVDELEFPATWVDQVMYQSNYDLTVVAHAEPRDIANFANPDYYWHYDNPQFQELLEQADKAPNTDEEIPLMKQAARILSDDAAADFLWLLPNLVVTKSDITGVDQNRASLSFDMTGVSAPAA
ncbi:ABC transporter substrate-binding protein [Propionimicrobium sp. PCR01-08-3]|uniref:ABC transporter substrate-binding protein n=1 Tax=Propionimicrobium sp. PCR01-08-3 TaxID=3052086 RepID=UPI00255C6102|nr:ABC transporter substrate-binding protein [Propionimicrobium sp. PCR01-08-3]WIY83791.1 ABC transporter substrate-binding protein [Propionimicrobium sp. PCR01-08-3]